MPDRLPGSRALSAASVVCTGFHLGTRSGDAWLSLNENSATDTLRAGQRRGRLLGGSASEAHGLEAAACELARLGLLEKGGLTVNPDRVAICFANSKNAVQGGCAGESRFGDAYKGPAAWWQARLGSRGAALAPVAACASGAHAVALGAQWIADGYADAVVCGAIENEQSALVLAAYRQLGVLSQGGAMRPFDRRRDGFVPGSGAAMLLLESEEHARARGARVVGRVRGWWIGADSGAATSLAASGDSIAKAIEIAVVRSGATTIDYVNAHGTATRQNDEVESSAIVNALGNGVPVSSTKPFTGHWLGAAGALEAIICLMAMHEGYAPATLGLEEPDTGVDLDYICVAGREMELKSCLSLNYGFGGHIGALVLGRGS